MMTVEDAACEVLKYLAKVWDSLSSAGIFLLTSSFLIHVLARLFLSKSLNVTCFSPPFMLVFLYIIVIRCLEIVRAATHDPLQSCVYHTCSTLLNFFMIMAHGTFFIVDTGLYSGIQSPSLLSYIILLRSIIIATYPIGTFLKKPT